MPAEINAIFILGRELPALTESRLPSFQADVYITAIYKTVVSMVPMTLLLKSVINERLRTKESTIVIRCAKISLAGFFIFLISFENCTTMIIPQRPIKVKDKFWCEFFYLNFATSCKAKLSHFIR